MAPTQKIYQSTLSKIYARFSLKNSKTQQSDEFTSCYDLPLNRFIKIVITTDLSWLGNCKDPQATWESIYSEYAELSGDSSNQQALSLAKQITTLTNRINITAQIINYLYIRGNVPELIEELKNMGYRLAFTDLEADLKRVESLSKSDYIKLTAANDAYAKLEKGNKASEMDWYRMLSAIAKYRQVTSINPAMISVAEFIAMEKDFKDYCNAMSKINR